MVAQAAELLGESLAADYLRESYAEGETFSNAFAKLYTRIFGEHGLILLDPADPNCIASPRRCSWMRCAAPPNWTRRCWRAIASCRPATITSR